MSGQIVTDGVAARKRRGAFFTPAPIAEFLVRWALNQDPATTILDPTCGEGVFLQAAGRELRRLGADGSLDHQVFGVDLHRASLEETSRVLETEALDATLHAEDFFALPPPGDSKSVLPRVDAVVGNPPFVRYQQHIGAPRRRGAVAALRQGVRLSNLSSSWAPLLVHAGAFLRPHGRLAMVLPAELMTVGYAEPIRRWLKERFGAVRLVVFEKLQFADALEDVILVLASGSGGCEAFSLCYAHDLDDVLRSSNTELAVAPADGRKWTELLLTPSQRQLFGQLTKDHFVTLGNYGSPALGTVTGANRFFALRESTRQRYGLSEEQVARISPPGTRHLKGSTFTAADWTALRQGDEPVWLLRPDPDDDSPELRRYLRHGIRLQVPAAYKCQVRTPWWRPPMVRPPDLFFTYMSHQHPRLVGNLAGVSFLNSMHGVRLGAGTPAITPVALPLLGLNSLSLLGAELHGRSYGGGILKMEPREASLLPMPAAHHLCAAWRLLGAEVSNLDRQLRAGGWREVVARVDEVLLGEVLSISQDRRAQLSKAAGFLRSRRHSRAMAEPGA